MKIDKFYMCHYTKLNERKNYIQKHIHTYNLELEWIEKFDKEDIDFESLEQNYPKILHNMQMFNRKLTKPEISLCLKHLHVFSEVISKGYDNVVVFEDDIILCDDFLNKLDLYTQQLPVDYDILWIGTCCNLHAQFVEGNNIYPANSSRCTHAYLISNSGCKKMSSLIHHLNHPIDWYFNFVISNLNLKNFWAEPDLVKQNLSFDSAINAGNVQ
jgi:GR25 family glycosyltransferase involved in LPS biosynthesis